MIFSLQNENPVGLDLFWITQRRDSAATIQLYVKHTIDTMIYSLYDVLAAILNAR